MPSNQQREKNGHRIWWSREIELTLIFLVGTGKEDIFLFLRNRNIIIYEMTAFTFHQYVCPCSLFSWDHNQN